MFADKTTLQLLSIIICRWFFQFLEFCVGEYSCLCSVQNTPFSLHKINIKLYQSIILSLLFSSSVC